MRGGGSHTLISASPIILSTESERENILAPISDKIYFVLETSKLYIYNSGNWLNAVYTHPSFDSHSTGLYKISVNGQGHVDGATAVTKSDITELGVVDVNSIIDTAHGGTGANNTAQALANLSEGKKFSGDFNTNFTSGVYWCHLSDCTNTPLGNNPIDRYGFLIIAKAYASVQEGTIQLYYDYKHSDHYSRSYINDTWNEWIKLDASNKVSKSGDTMTGRLQVPDLHVISSDEYTFITMGGMNPYRHQIITDSSRARMRFRSISSDGVNYIDYFLDYGETDINSVSSANIYTSKDIIPISNGGTGSNNRAQSLLNLIAGSTHNGDFNSFFESGVYWVQLPECTNTPFGDNPAGRFGFLIILKSHQGIECTLQFYVDHNYTQFYTRTYVNAAWTGWQKLDSSDKVNKSGDTMYGHLRSDLGNTVGFPTAGFVGANNCAYLEAYSSADQYGIRRQLVVENTINNPDSSSSLHLATNDGSNWTSNIILQNILPSSVYGTSLPSSGTTGQIFFLQK